ncbi:hypothetical protein ZIOFF_001401 [Zingiber officinale]|uniref:Uncharacterized protein n=1 Tax=Zingiber officinale TaxID=94328 RepID=A0A8J5HVD5_ZINOF|nr:hypothetical protein ZIOFF_001401 [Zingiber officinale]
MEGQHVSKKPALSVYVDVFGGPPRFTTSPFPSCPDDYAEIFRGPGTSCSIPFLDLPPKTYDLDGDTAIVRDGPRFDYSEVFGDLDFREFFVQHKDLFSSSQGVEVGSTNGRCASESLLLAVFVECSLTHVSKICVMPLIGNISGILAVLFILPFRSSIHTPSDNNNE